MCGIAGMISWRQDKQQAVQRMISCISHRGPDGEAVWQNDSGIATLGHRRLSVIDLSEAASQPMHYLGRYTIVHNGEIYNYKELRQLLLGKGYTFRSQSDTEIILAAYDHWKADCLQLFDGMFAFAIWDEQEQKLFAARDRFGEKPFYYHVDLRGNEFYFSSGIRSLLYPKENFRVNNSLLLHYIANGVSSVYGSSETFYETIRKLPARHYLEYSYADNELNIVPYFDIDKSVSHVSAEDAVEHFRNLFFNSVHKRLRSDVEIGTSLSGGIDSSSVVAAIHQLKEANAPQKAFTASFPGFEKDETSFAKKVAGHFGLQQFITTPTANDIVDDLEKFLSHHDEPVSSASVYAQYKVYGLAKQHGVKVVLDGQGADEILAGYSKYIHWFLQELYASGSSQLLSEREAFGDTPFGWKNKLAAKFPSWTAIQLEKKALLQQKRSFFNRNFVSEHFNKGSVYKPVVRTLNDILYFDVFGGGLEELLRNADRNAMAHGVEARLPFLNHDLVQFVFSLPSGFKMHKGYTKYILRQAMDDLLPKEICWRKDKIGFEPPQQQWMQHIQLRDKIHEAKKKLVQEKILDKTVLDKPVEAKAAHEAGNFDWRFLSAAGMF